MVLSGPLCTWYQGRVQRFIWTITKCKIVVKRLFLHVVKFWHFSLCYITQQGECFELIWPKGLHEGHFILSGLGHCKPLNCVSVISYKNTFFMNSCIHWTSLGKERQVQWPVCHTNSTIIVALSSSLEINVQTIEILIAKHANIIIFLIINTRYITSSFYKYSTNWITNLKYSKL